MPEQHSGPSRAIRALVVDDDEDITDLLTIGLQRLGFQAVSFNDPIAALTAVREDPDAFDVVVSDELMPTLRGHELILRVREIRPSIRSILCSGSADTGLDALARDSGVDLFLRKPLSVAQIGAAILSLSQSAV